MAIKNLVLVKHQYETKSVVSNLNVAFCHVFRCSLCEMFSSSLIPETFTKIELNVDISLAVLLKNVFCLKHQWNL
jgi:hypothetical protein